MWTVIFISRLNIWSDFFLLLLLCLYFFSDMNISAIRYNATRTALNSASYFAIATKACVPSPTVMYFSHSINLQDNLANSIIPYLWKHLPSIIHRRYCPRLSDEAYVKQAIEKVFELHCFHVPIRLWVAENFFLRVWLKIKMSFGVW
jgi:hypothetical protein